MRSVFSSLNVSNKNNLTLTAQSARLDIIGELEAIVMYQNHFDATDDQDARKTIADIMEEEKVHVGQLFGLLFKLDPESKVQFEKGYTEFMQQD